ncbi:low temperature requirement protein A [Intrasporangium oryzae NRRL B-24470]|uniref:Low temperature requirement protein A n=1 Tax=Intrasporangium oryzae NRRL B-24470 TaxID=1386089 RepID=W9GGU5_9MICO|nr:low temperature requirement protein A [Intrasporangium oryzae]EWT03079.1 low temperature requirement protein A [Intrasporangium oryzae NRRL B-24470]
MSSVNIVPLRRRMVARDPHEKHRVATPLELFFDLVFVVAIASAAAQWHHGLAGGELGDLVGYLMVFFAIWWAWMNYTWFASSYDCDDVTYRLLTFTIMAGSLMLAAGIPDLFATRQSVLVVAGYAVMRFAMVAMWLRAAASHPEGRTTALTYAAGIAAVQVLWIARLAIEGRTALMVSFFALVVLELLVPIVAERRGVTPFHPHHIAERYALLTIIVLGEVILASVQAVQVALGQGAQPGLLALIVGGLLIVFSMWWLYFKREHAVLFEGSVRSVFVTGYGHYLVFASVAATGAALAASVDLVQGHAHTSARVVGLALAGAVAVYTWCLTVMHAMAGARPAETRAGVGVGLVVLGVAALAPPIGITVLAVGLVLAVAVAHHVWLTQRVDQSIGSSRPVSTS